MDYVFPSSNNETMLVSSNKEPNHENLNSNHDQDTSLFGQFPLPSLDEISTSGILQNHHHHHLTSNRSKPTTSIHENEPPPSPGKTKRVRKKRSAGKKDRHSKIHTAQGLRDRRMRLSLHIARKFFGLQDMLGFDKASKTIDWLFCKSKKAIEEVTECHKSRTTTQSHVISKENIERCQSPLSDCVADSDIDYDAASNKGKQLKIQDHENSMKPTESDILARESRDKARARARERTRERMMINNLEKSKQMFGENPNDNFDHPQLGFAVNPNNHYNIGESSSSLEYSGTHHFFDQQAQLDGIAQKTENYLGTTTGASSLSYFSGFGYNKYFANPPAGWLNSSNTFLGFLGGWDSENFRMESENYGNMSNIASSTGDIHEQIVPHTNLHFQSQHQRD